MEQRNKLGSNDFKRSYMQLEGVNMVKGEKKANLRDQMQTERVNP